MGFRALRVRFSPWCLIAASGLLFVPSLSLAKGPEAKPRDSVLRSITVFPSKIALDGPRDEQRLVVMGEYSDLTHKDLTRNAKFGSTATNIARVEPSGIAHPAGDGDTFVTI